MTTMNGKRPSSIPSRHLSEPMSQHFDLIKYIYDCERTQNMIFRYRVIMICADICICRLMRITRSVTHLFHYVSAWNSVSKELDMCHNQPHSNSSSHRNGASIAYYQELKQQEPNSQPKSTYLSQCFFYILDCAVTRRRDAYHCALFF